MFSHDSVWKEKALDVYYSRLEHYTRKKRNLPIGGFFSSRDN
jgi:hypothetical protein